jgi:hypothetical protein
MRHRSAAIVTTRSLTKIVPGRIPLQGILTAIREIYS